MKKMYIILAAVVGIVAMCVTVLAYTNLWPSQKAQTTLSTNSYNEQNRTADADTRTQATNEVIWKSFSFNGYSFDIPNNWQAMEPAEESAYHRLEFKKSDGKYAATLISPPPVTGYEGWKFTTTSHRIQKNGNTFDISMWLGESDGTNNQEMTPPAIIFVQREDYQNVADTKYFDPGRGIQLMTDATPEMDKIMEHIYESITPQDIWKTFTSDIFYFQYPTAWTAEVDAGAGHRDGIFTDSQDETIASFHCPIPGDKKISDYQITEKRLLKLGDKAFSIVLATDPKNDSADKAALFFTNLTPQQDEQGGIFGNECSLTTTKDDLSDVFQRIYQSSGVQTKN